MPHIGELLNIRAAESRSARFVKCGSSWQTFADVADVSQTVAAGLSDIGVQPGDRVATIMTNRLEVIQVTFACAKLGAILVPLNPFLRGEFLRHQLADSGARYLVSDAAGLRSAAPVLSATAVEAVIAVDPAPDFTSVRAHDYEALLKSRSRPIERAVAGHDLFAILYTSGTTGAPKGCMVSHDYACISPQVAVEVGWLQPNDVQFTAFPLFHMGGLSMILGSLISKAPVAIQPTFSASTFIEQAAQESATLLRGVGAIGLSLLAQPPRKDDREHHFRLACFVPMAIPEQRAFEERFATPFMGEIYGQTECIPATITPFDSERRPGSIGRAAPQLEVRIVDDGDREVAQGEVGEIVVRPRRPGVMFSGYYGRPEDTLAACRNYWHHTGDYGRVDEDGYFYFIDRKKDSLRRRGENISSLELEAAIRVHPDLQAVAVCPVPSALSEDDIRAFIVLEPGKTLSPSELFEFFKDALPYFAIPRYVTICEELPLTPTGRVQKHLLRKQPLDAGSWDFDTLGLHVSASQRRS
jgi:crotonobetaine/carnitine-CoA ligase